MAVQECCRLQIVQKDRRRWIEKDGMDRKWNRRQKQWGGRRQAETQDWGRQAALSGCTGIDSIEIEAASIHISILLHDFSRSAFLLIVSLYSFSAQEI